MKGFLGFWTLLVKSIGLPLAIASGLSVGKEGPSAGTAIATAFVSLLTKTKVNPDIGECGLELAFETESDRLGSYDWRTLACGTGPSRRRTKGKDPSCSPGGNQDYPRTERQPTGH